MKAITVNQIQYAYEKMGSGSPLVLLHGFTGSKANWQHNMPHLAEKHHVIAMDILGHGGTEKPQNAQSYRMEYVADDIIKVLASITNESVTLLGYSMGGRLALYIATHYPDVVNRLILESASPGLATETERQQRRASDEQLAERIEREGIPAFVEFWENIPLFASQKRLSQATQDALHAQRLNNTPTGLANSLRGMGTGVQPSMWEKLSQIQQPTLLITGELDTKFHTIAIQMQTAMPNATHTSVADAGHTVHLEQPQAYIKQILSFTSA